MCLVEIEEGLHRNVREDSKEDIWWHVGEIVDLCYCFLFLSTSGSHVHRGTFPLPAVLLVRHLEYLGLGVDLLRGGVEGSL